METETYFVAIDDMKVARYVTLETALILEKALFEKYFNDTSMVISVARDIYGEEKSDDE